MNIVCDKVLLSAAIDGVSKAVTMRSAIPVLEGILLKAEGFQLNLTGYDLEMGIVTTIEANVKEAGEVVLNAKLLSSMISRMPAGQVSILSAENGKTTIQSGVVQFEIQSMPANDFPELPNTGAEETLTIKTGVLKDMIDRTLYAVSQDEKKPAHTGELFEILPDKLTVVALDGYRLAIVERPVTAVKDIRIIVPSKTMTEVAHLLPNDDEEPVHISANRRYVVFMAGGYTIMSRLIEGEFLNYRNVIPADSRTRVTIDTKEFIETIERASLIITERLKNPLRISFTEGRVVVRCQTNLGRVVDEFNADCEGDEVEIGFNNRYLLDALRNAAKRGVDVRLVLPGIPDKKLVFRLSRSYYLPLLRAGVRIYEYTPGFLHAKCWVSDDVTAVVGSINMDYRSLFLHFECGVLLQKNSQVAVLRDDVRATLPQCREIQVMECRTSLPGTVLDSVLRLLSPLM